MNEVTNQSPQAIQLRAAVVFSKPNANQSVRGGNSLPLDFKPQGNAIVNKSQQIPVAESSKQIRVNVEDAIAEMNRYSQSIQRDIQFTVDQTSGRTVVAVVDRASQEVIRQIPDEIFLKLARTLKENLASGSNESPHLISAKA